jgi:hypothetical protein
MILSVVFFAVIINGALKRPKQHTIRLLVHIPIALAGFVFVIYGTYDESISTAYGGLILCELPILFDEVCYGSSVSRWKSGRNGGFRIG